MEIFPAIDLKNGQCVRLTQGDFNTAKIYESDPLLQARKFAEAGATWLHMVDLDGARLGQMRQFDLIANLAKQTPLKIQVGGGIRDAETIEKLLESGVQRVVVGSLAVKDRQLVQTWLRQFGAEHVTLAFDIKYVDDQPEILTHGWQSGSQQLLWDILDAYEGSGLRNILCTDVSRDGMLAGVNNELYLSIQEHAPKLGVLASGGVSNIDDLLGLAKIGAAGVIVGKALYEGRVDLADAIQKVKHAG
ncbi:MAG: 1-(5-phosphoribosyl)-5-[(5-phosphoribosylamino)methylideneamino]imidazole-4-carboxamide isomerase [Alphaproteobacteria bacterium]|nr:1-(5-phosphoribosyl)-5-[(5-phosphoribosylamino)methylideneamino]imidazole-4-carboxamide isomerase [Alphaproteobacteria bacterium]